MTDDQAAEPRVQRVRLGGELRRIRLLAGLSGRELAPIVGIGQATLSRIENGKAVPSLPEVMAWAEATNAPAEARETLTGLTEAALNEVETWRTRQAGGLPAMQQDMRLLELTTGSIRIFQTTIVPALMQTPEYAKRVFAITDVVGTGDYEAATASRVERQQILYDTSHEFEFLMTEPALRWQPGSRVVQQAQLDRIITLASLPNMSVGIIPLSAELHAIPWTGFNIYENREDERQSFVTIEVPHGRITAADPADVTIYLDQMALLRRGAHYGDAAIQFLRRVIQDLSQE